MPSRLTGLIKAFGSLEGIKIYSRIKAKRSGWIYLKDYKTRFFLRPKSSDLYTFDQVFIKEQYNIKLPFVPKTIIDAGANIGLSAAYFANRFPGSQIIAIEPDKGNFDVLLKNTAFYKNVKALNVGVWNKDTHLQIINSDSVQNAFMVTESLDKANGIPAVSIETVMMQNAWHTLDILKIDIEGSEKEVFEDNTGYWLPKTKAIFVETHDRMRKGSSKAIFKAISQYNFSFTTSDENLVFINDELV